ncbi:DUF3572 domain-containing protein [Celeribacter marinus]|uniref:Uncharacterized protein n=1 Tax=Celeribacter marinus TaxID=1397108 RepID=A0A0N7HIC8_9RHOB|nr:DUF3572 domain-containing protein [Celeribacter marinus]ALI54861.1 hypothetical protein IMCC12053_913 [Celeribacter marinus]SFK00400.1 Protein of unknown function [Celeribacter marinus]
MKQDSAEALALNILAWLVGDDDLLPTFLGSTGMDGAELRARAGEAEVLSAVLDFLMMNDEWVNRWADETQGDPMGVMRARQALPGGEQVNWT